MDVRRIQVGEGPQLRALRLRALADAPHAFADSLERARAQPEAFWTERAASGASGADQATFIAVDHRHWLGMAAGFFRPESRHIAHLVAMWVEPSARRLGIGQALVGTVLSWAEQEGARAVELWVTQANLPALALYKRMGFTATGRTQPLPSHPSLPEINMLRVLDEPPLR